MTRGCTPYPDIDNFDVKQYVMAGNRMDKPDFAPSELWVALSFSHSFLLLAVRIQHDFEWYFERTQKSFKKFPLLHKVVLFHLWAFGTVTEQKKSKTIAGFAHRINSELSSNLSTQGWVLQDNGWDWSTCRNWKDKISNCAPTIKKISHPLMIIIWLFDKWKVIIASWE